jgi:hypothetical protein
MVMAANEHRSHNAPSSIIRQSIIFWTTGVAGSLDPATEAAVTKGAPQDQLPARDFERSAALVLMTSPGPVARHQAGRGANQGKAPSAGRSGSQRQFQTRALDARELGNRDCLIGASGGFDHYPTRRGLVIIAYH